MFLLVCAGGAIVLLTQTRELSLERIKEFFAGVFFVDSITAESLRQKYARASAGGRKIKILVVPGHDQEYSGTGFGGVRELDLTLETAERLASHLGRDSGLEVLVAQDKKGYAPFLVEYFEKNRDEIRRFRIGKRAVMEALTHAGIVDEESGVLHPRAPADYAARLYGINKWANENGVDIVLHIHFNDYPRRAVTRPGAYAGFAIYAPEIQYSNARASRGLASSLAKTLEAYAHISTFPLEREGIVADQDLIALGANNSLSAAAALVEYGYIYEPQFQQPEVRPYVLEEAAFQTGRGIRLFLNPQASVQKSETTFLPHRWNSDLRPGVAGRDVLALQAALVSENLYPPQGKEKSDCPLTGRFFDCTDQGVRAFQRKYGIARPTGIVDALTRERLNQLYGGGLSSR